MKWNVILIIGLLAAGLILGGCQQDSQKSVEESKTAVGENNSSGDEHADESTSAGDKDDAGFTADDKVVTINGKVLSYEDLQFYQLMDKVEIELNRAYDQQKLQGDELKDKMAYWDEQLKYHDNFNVNLSNMIEQHAMYLLAKEKGLDVESSEVEVTIEEFTGKVKENEPASQLIAAFPEDAYQNRLKNFFTEKLLTEQIYETLKTEVVKEKPKASEKEIAYDTSKKYNELYQSQIASLELKINAAEKE